MRREAGRETARASGRERKRERGTIASRLRADKSEMAAELMERARGRERERQRGMPIEREIKGCAGGGNEGGISLHRKREREWQRVKVFSQWRISAG